MHAIHTRSSLRLLTILTVILTLAGPRFAFGQQPVERLPFEKVMRDAQARYQYVTGQTWGWPACCGQPSGTAPAYPPDGYYGEEVDDQCAVGLVASIRDCIGTFVPVFLAPAYENPTGTTVDLFDPDTHLKLTDFGWTLPGPAAPTITTSNYRTYLGIFDAAVQMCRARPHQAASQHYPDQEYYRAGISQGPGAPQCPSAFAESCEAALASAVGSASCMWGQPPQWTNGAPNLPLGIREGACKTFDPIALPNTPWAASVYKFAVRGRVYSDLRDEPASAQVTIYVQVDKYGQQASNPEAFVMPADGTWRRFDGTSGGSEYTSAQVADFEPTITLDCGSIEECDPDTTVERGWFIVDEVAVVRPNFSPQTGTGNCEDTTVLPPLEDENSEETENESDDSSDDDDCQDDDLTGGENGAGPET